MATNIICYLFVIVIAISHFPDKPLFLLFIKLLAAGLLAMITYYFGSYSFKNQSIDLRQFCQQCFCEPPLILFLTIGASVFSSLIANKLHLTPWLRSGQLISTVDISWLYYLYHLLLSLIAIHFTMKGQSFERGIWCSTFLLAASGIAFNVSSPMLWPILIAMLFSILDSRRCELEIVYRDRGTRWSISFLLVFFIICVISTFSSTCFWESFQHLGRLFFCISFFLIIVSFTTTTSRQQSVIYSLLFTGSIIFVSCVLTDITVVFSGVNIFKMLFLHLGGAGMRAANLEFYSYFVLPLLLVVFLSRTGPLKIFAGGMLLYGLPRLFFCGYKKVFFTAPFWLLLFGILYALQTRLSVKAVFKSTAVVLLILAVISPLFYNQVSDMLHRLAGKLSSFSNLNRITGWIHGFKVLSHCLWFGNGFNNHHALGRFIDFNIPPKDLLIMKTFLKGHFHNSVFQILEGAGLMGLVSLVLFIGTVLYRSVCSGKHIDNIFLRISAIAFIAGISGNIFSSLFHGSHPVINDLPFEAWIGLGLLCVLTHPKSRPEGKNVLPQKGKKVFRLCFWLLLVLFAFCCGLLPLFNRTMLARASFLEQQGKSNSVESCLKWATILEPLNADRRVSLGDFYKNRGKLSMALGEYEKALRLNPFYSPLLSKTGRASLKLNNTGQALFYFKRGADADPYGFLNQDVYVELALALALQGDYSEAKQALTKNIIRQGSPLFYQYWRKNSNSPRSIDSYYFDPLLTPGTEPGFLFSPQPNSLKLEYKYRPEVNLFGQPRNLSVFDQIANVPGLDNGSLSLRKIVNLVKEEMESWSKYDHRSAYIINSKLRGLFRSTGFYAEEKALVESFMERSKSAHNKNFVMYGHFSLGDIYACQGLYDKALKEFRIYREWSGVPLLQEIELRQKLGDEEGFFQLALNLKRKETFFIKQYLIKSNAALKENRYGDAAEAFRQCRLRINPWRINERIYFTESIGKCLVNNDKFQEAREEFRKSILVLCQQQNYASSWDEFLRRTADLVVTTHLNENHDLTESLSSELRFVKKLGPSDFATVYLAYVALSILENQYINLVLEGKDRLAAENFVEASDVFQKASRLLKNHPIAYYHLSQTYRQAGDHQTAREYMDKYFQKLKKVIPRGQKISITPME